APPHRHAAGPHAQDLGADRGGGGAGPVGHGVPARGAIPHARKGVRPAPASSSAVPVVDPRAPRRRGLAESRPPESGSPGRASDAGLLEPACGQGIDLRENHMSRRFPIVLALAALLVGGANLARYARAQAPPDTAIRSGLAGPAATLLRGG